MPSGQIKLDGGTRSEAGAFAIAEFERLIVDCAEMCGVVDA